MEIEGISPADFDQWAETYDRNVLDETQFPFTGYQRVLNKVIKLAQAQPGMRILDVGTGTGNLIQLFSRLGCSIWATDFSPAMLAVAREKLPQVHFILSNILDDWPQELPPIFDRILSTYVFHHFELAQKVHLCVQLLGHLAPRGKLILADIAFHNSHSVEEFKRKLMGEWEDEYYWLADETVTALQAVNLHAVFTPVSACAGVFTIGNI